MLRIKDGGLGIASVVMPKSNRKFWREKIERNKARDLKVGRQLRYQGWKVIRVREHRLKKDSEVVFDRISDVLRLKNS